MGSFSTAPAGCRPARHRPPWSTDPRPGSPQSTGTVVALRPAPPRARHRGATRRRAGGRRTGTPRRTRTARPGRAGPATRSGPGRGSRRSRAPGRAARRTAADTHRAVPGRWARGRARARTPRRNDGVEGDGRPGDAVETPADHGPQAPRPAARPAQAREQRPVSGALRPEQQRPPVDPHAEVGPDVGAVALDHLDAVPEAHVVLDAVVDVQHGREQHGERQAAGDNLQQRHRAPGAALARSRRAGRQRDRQHQEHAQVHVRERLQQPAGDEAGQRPAGAGVDEAVQLGQGERAPPAGQHLQPGDVARGEIRAAGEEDAGDEGGIGAAGEPAHQDEHRETGEGVAGEEGHVVGEDGVAGEPVDRGDEEGDAEQVLRIGERVGVRMEDRRVPQIPGVGDDRVADPAEDPRVQHRIAGVARQGVGQARQQRGVDGERQRDEPEGHHDRRRRRTCPHWFYVTSNRFYRK